MTYLKYGRVRRNPDPITVASGSSIGPFGLSRNEARLAAIGGLALAAFILWQHQKKEVR